MKQLPLLKMENLKEFGGSLLKGKRKSKRPLSARHAIHLVVRANVYTCGSFRAFSRPIINLINKFAVRFDIKIYELSVNSNHLHLLIKLNTKDSFAGFVRALCGALSLEYGVRWIHRPYTRIVGWGAAFARAKNYVIKNISEASGQIAYVPRKKNKSTSQIKKL